jgi:hypothetical protein
MIKDHTICALMLNTCVQFKHVNHIITDMDELELLSSLNTVGYIEFDVLCNLSDLEEKLFYMLICHGCLGIHIILLANITTKEDTWYIEFIFVQI